MDTETEKKMDNPLRTALDALGRPDAVRAIVDACDREVERHQIHAWARQLGHGSLSIPPAAAREAIDRGFKRLGVRKGLTEAAWKPWIKLVTDRRKAADKRRKDVREAAGLPPFRGRAGRPGGGRAPQPAPAEAVAE